MSKNKNNQMAFQSEHFTAKKSGSLGSSLKKPHSRGGFFSLRYFVVFMVRCLATYNETAESEKNPWFLLAM